MFQKGQSGNPKGGLAHSVLKMKWELIDEYVNEATKRAMAVVDGTDADFVRIEDPKDRVDAKLKAIGHILKLAPQRQQLQDPEGKAVSLIGFKFINPSSDQYDKTIVSEAPIEGGSGDEAAQGEDSEIR